MKLVSSMRRRRHEKKAAIKAAEVQAKQTAKAIAKQDRAREKYLQKTSAKIRALDARASKKQYKQDAETAKALVAHAKSRRLTAGKVLGWVGAARVIIPVAVPLAYRTLAKFGSQNSVASTTTPLSVHHARIANLRNRAGGRNVPESVRTEIMRKLATLETTLDSASRSQSSQETILTAITAELDQLDSQLTDTSH